MLSRVADNLYWMSRYLERAEHTVRILDVNLSLMLDRSETSEEGRWQRVLELLGRPLQVPWSGSAADVVRLLTFHPSNRCSVISCISAARENARQVRDEISTEQWQRLNRLYHQVTNSHLATGAESELSDFYASVLDGLHLFKGVTDTTMIHGEGWQFIRIGRYLERAYATATLLEVYYRDVMSHARQESNGVSYLELVGLLRSNTAFEAYCQVYTADLIPERILEFLLLNSQFPHALRYCVDALRDALLTIQQEGSSRNTPELNSMVGRVQASLSFITVKEVLETGPESYLRKVREQCSQIHELIYNYYIHYSVQTALAL